MAALEGSLEPGKRNKLGELAKILNKYKYLYMLITPGIIFYIIFHYVPMYGIILAFKQYMYNKGIMGSPWVGFSNFEFIFKNPEFWTAFGNTVIISFGKLVFGFPVPILLSMLLNELRHIRFKRIVQSILYMPHFFSWVIVYGLFLSLFSITSGAVSKIILDVTGQSMPMLIGSPKYFRAVVYITDIWKGAGWGTIIYLAAISNINPELYESAIIDGANRFKRAVHITIPSLKYAIIILLILNMGGIMQAGFDQIFNFYSPAVYKVGDIIDTYIYRMGIVGSRYELGTTVGLFQSVINCALLLLSNWIVKKFGEEGIF